jgi:hypothetical protein
MHPGFSDRSAGVAELHDDADARSFAGGVIRDLMRADPAAFRSWILHVCEETRQVACIRFDELDIQKNSSPLLHISAECFVGYPTWDERAPSVFGTIHLRLLPSKG